MKKLLFGFALTVFLLSCSGDTIELPMGPAGSDFTVWNGPLIDFVKLDGVDPTLDVNQDCLTDNVCLTRGISGSIFNAVSQFSSADNPTGTEWAFGTTAELDQLTFQGFQATHGRQSPSVIGRDMVLHLIEDDVYLDIKFNSWARRKDNGEGGFSYTRRSE
ncbi:MAG: hypothetical protein AAFQ02_05250 [Bacteroidota bacterium]